MCMHNVLSSSPSLFLIYFLKHQQFRFGQILVKGRQEQCRRRFIDNSSISTQPSGHDGLDSRSPIILTILLLVIDPFRRYDRPHTAPNRQDGSLGRIDDGTEFGYPKHTQIGYAERTALVLLGGELPVSGPGGQIFHLGGYVRQAQGIGGGYDGGNETCGSCNGNADIDGIVGTDRTTLDVVGAIHFRHIAQRQGSTSDDQIVDGNLDVVIVGKGFP
mmetsp:Transcript_30611/g.66254  ORF Transcript_30611/g.66254 Transcript_30611/m.66254 type:complete len:217 (-) Transcript_30611:1153-1803(-)